MKKDVISLFEKQAALLPEKVAVVQGEASISFGDLNEKANQLARLLLGKGITTDSIVAIIADPSVDMIVAIMGILKAGGAYLPIDPRYPGNRIRDILLDSAAPIVVSQIKYTGMVAGLQADTSPEPLFLDGETPPFRELDSTNPDIPISPSSLAYIIYTSGSTGKPKGVMVEHGSLMTMLEAFHEISPLLSSEICLSVASFAFDVSVYEFFTSLPFGASLHLLNTHEIIDIVSFAEYLLLNRITSVYIPPSLVVPVTSHLKRNNITIPCNKILVGVEPLKQKTLWDLHNQLSGGLIINAYGVTEAAVCATAFLFDKATDPEKNAPIGKQLFGYHVLVVDADFRQVKPGEQGQIIIGGPAVARGYLNNEPLTHEKFRQGIMPGYPEMRFYLTGDVATCLPDGNIEFIGRIDNQVKITGHRVETGEIESVLEDHPDVDRAVVIALKDKHTNTFLKAFYTSSTQQPIPDLKRYLANHLPEYMIPAQFEFLVHFPQTVSQKIDRQKLAHQSTAATFARLPQQPDDITGTLTGIFAAYLENPVEPEKTLFEQGGDSVDVMNILLEIHHHFNLHIPVKTFYEHSSVSSLTGFITSALNKQTVPLPGITRTDRRQNRFPLTATQQELYLLHHLDRSSTIHNIVIRFELVGALDFRLFHKALNLIFERHDVFRTSFIEDQGDLYQRIVAPFEIPLPFTDLEGNSDAEARLHSLHTALGQTIPELDNPPLFRVHLVKMDSERHYLFLVIHHIIFDGWSAGIFMKELQRCYKTTIAGEECPADDHIDFMDYACWYHEHLEKGAWLNDLEYWRKRFPHPPHPIRITSRRAEDFDYTAAERFSWVIPQPLIEKAREVAMAFDTSLFSVLLATFQLLLCRMSGQPEVHVGTPYANRSFPGLDQMMGYMTNMLPLTTIVAPDMTFEALIKEVDRSSREAFAHASYPFGRVAKELGFSSAHIFNPVLLYMFIMQNWQGTVDHRETSAIGVTQKELGNNSAKALLTMNLEQTATAMECWFEYPAELLRTSEAEQLSLDYLNILAYFIACPSAQTKETPGLTFRRKVQTAVLMGEGNLMLQCAIMLQSHGWSIQEIITNDHRVRNWSKTESIPVTGPSTLSYLPERLLMTDYLFSINNPWIIREEVINQKSLKVINYHDSLLPRYAGMYATNWSLINGESLHGITWHMVTTNIDAGDICIQVPISINPGETMESLNLRCFEMALKGFQTLVGQIEKGEMTTMPQDISNRIYYGRTTRPADRCRIDFSRGSTEIARLCRATDAGNHLNNEFGVAWFMHETRIFIAPEAVPTTLRMEGAPGAVLSTDNDTLVVATGSDPVRFNRLFNPEGERLLISDLAKAGVLQPGTILNSTPHMSEPLQISSLLKNEPFWVKVLGNCNPPEVPFSSRIPAYKCQPDHITLDLKNTGLFRLRQKMPPTQAINIFLSGLSLFFQKLLGQKEVTLPVSFSGDGSAEIHPYVPVSLSFDGAKSWAEQEELAGSAIEDLRSHAPFWKDIFHRYPDLRKSVHRKQFFDSPVAVAIITGEQPHIPFYDAQLYLLFNPNQLTLELRSENPTEHILSVNFIKPLLLQLFNNLVLPGRTLSRVGLLSEAELQQIAREVGASLYDDQTTSGVLDIFLHQVEQSPFSIAVEGASQKVTYLQLNQLSDSIAMMLLREGARPGMSIGCHINRSPELVAAIIGIFKAGCTYLPLDRKAPVSRLNQMVEDAHLTIVLTDGSTEPFTTQNIRFIRLTNLRQTTAGEETLLKYTFTPKIPAYIIFTSGTTGRAKGVMISHASLHSFIIHAMARYHVIPADRILQFATPSFDASIEEIFLAICSGATLVIRSEEMAGSLPDFLAETREKQITLLDLPTAFWNQITRLMVENKLSFPESVRLVIIGGEEAQNNTMNLWRNNFIDYPQLINTYGPTETTVVATTCYLEEAPPIGAFPIGTPLGKTVVVPIDDDLNPVPCGIAGQMLICGPQVAMGYINQKELSDKSFLQTNFSGHQRSYLSGDYAVKDHTGNLYFLGRRDNQIKIRGFRVEKEEIDKKILENGEIRESLTIYKPGQGTATLVTYVIPRSPGQYPTERLLEKLHSELPPFMIPAAIVQIDRIPLTRNGKVDLASLPEPVLSQGEIPTETLTPDTVAIVNIYKEILNLERCNSKTNFFHAGGDSLSALTLLSRIKDVSSVHLTIGEVYGSPTVQGIADAVTRHRGLQVLAADDGTPHSVSPYLVCLKKGGERNPLITIYFDAGNNHLAEMIPKDQPAYTLIPFGSDGERIHHYKVGRIAQTYLQILKKTFGDRPLILAGFSFGGIIALELAIRMRNEGMHTASLFLVDTVGPTAWRKLIRHTAFQRRMELAWNQWVCQFLSRLGKDIPPARRNGYILSAWRKAAAAYKPQTKDDPMSFTLIRSKNSLSDEPMLTWEAESGFIIKVAVVDGDHHSIIRDQNKIALILSCILPQS